MTYKRFGNTIIARIDRDEELLEQLSALARQENIALASVSGLGAIKAFTVGVFLPDEKKYVPVDFRGCYEIVSLTGTISSMRGEPYLHLHMSAGNRRGEVVGGHLNRALVSATCELVISLIDGRAERRFDEETGLKLIDFDLEGQAR